MSPSVEVFEDLKSEQVERLEAENKRLREVIRDLQKEKERLSHLDDLGYDGILIVQDFRIQSANRRLQEIMGYSAEEMLGMHFTDFIVEEDIPLLVNAYGRHIGGERELGILEFRIRHKAGEVLTLNINSSVIEYGGKPAEFIVVRDRTAHRRAEQVLQSVDTTLNDLIQFSPGPVAIFSPEGEFLRGNDAFLKLSPGLAAGNVNLFDDALFEDSTPQLCLSPLRDGNTVSVSECWIHRPGEDGRSKRFCLGIHAFAVSTNGHVGHYVVIADDQTTARLTEQQRKLMHAALDAAVNAVVIADADGVIEWANPAMGRLFAQAASTLPGVSLRSLLTGDRLGDKFDGIWAKVRDGGTYRGEVLYRRGLVHIGVALASFAPVRATHGDVSHVIAILQDITDQKRVEQSLREIEDRLRQSRRLESLGLLAGGVAHDFNSVLMAILSYADFLLRDAGLGDQAREDVEGIKRSAKHGSTLTNQLLAFGRSGSARMTRLNLNAVVTEMRKMLERLIGEHIVLDTMLDPNVEAILADRTQLDQVILNLAINARDAMPRGGRLTIRTARFEARDVPHGPFTEGRYVRLTVSDDGVGMDGETRARIFEPFFTTKARKEGTGLGLATVYGIVRHHAAEIFVESEPLRGATFHIYFPAAGESPELEKTPTATDFVRGSETILLVEGSREVLQIIQRMLERGGYNVLAASQVSEAIAIGTSYPGSIDMAIVDVVLPLMNGVEFVKTLRPQRPDMRVIYISGNDAAWVNQYVGETISENLFLHKPFEPSQLLRRVRQVMEEGDE
ncbi:MAG: PAS domain S-box protein [Deltaproteobacteria bacterium]|nr:PAS domain S-box protein [Deltaproteobacteria bacterium]